MAALTTHELIQDIIKACVQSTSVSAYTVRSYDLDILSVRVHLANHSFIEVFYNVATDKAAFALIMDDVRVYGKDNAKMGWHVHPLENPAKHTPCEAISFADFLTEVEKLEF